jgi:protocatechuate 3,4-dioxygenase beta subunit
MRVAFLLIFVVLAPTARSQAPELIPRVYVASQYTAPPDAPFSIVIADKDEPGDRLIVTGQALDGTTPVAGVSVYAFHTDMQGRYAIGVNNQDAELNPRLHGMMRTDANGRYQYETIRPGSYNNGASHVHYVVIAPGYKPRMLDLWFEDDPVLVARRKSGVPEIPPAIQKDWVAIRPVTRDANGIWHSTRNLEMVRE